MTTTTTKKEVKEGRQEGTMPEKTGRERGRGRVVVDEKQRFFESVTRAPIGVNKVILDRLRDWENISVRKQSPVAGRKGFSNLLIPKAISAV